LLFILGFLWPEKSESFESPSLTAGCLVAAEVLCPSDKAQAHIQRGWDNGGCVGCYGLFSGDPGHGETHWVQTDTVFCGHTLTADRRLCFYQVSVCKNPLLRKYVAQTQAQL